MARKNAVFASRRLSRLFLGLAIVLAIAVASHYALAQSSYDKGTPAESKGGTASDSIYSWDKVETVNLANGNLSMNIPLVTIGGRGSASFTLALSYNSKVWSAEHTVESIPQGMGTPPETVHHYSAKFDVGAMEQLNSLALGAGWSISKGPWLKSRIVLIDPITCSEDSPYRQEIGCYQYVLTRTWLVLTDGSEIEMRDSLTEGAPYRLPSPMYSQADRYRGRVYHSSDGSNITMVYDASGTGSWIFMADGSRIRTANNQTKIYDRQGNYLTIDYDVPSLGIVTYTDQLGRQTILSGSGSGATATIKGYGGVPDRVININTAVIGAPNGSGVADNLRADFRSLYRPFTSGDAFRSYSQGYVPHTIAGSHTDLFEGSEGGEDIDQYSAVTSINLTDGRSLRFRYNQYGEVAEVTYPGGGVSRIDYDGFMSTMCEAISPYFREVINRKVTKRKVLADGANVDATWTYGGTGINIGGTYDPGTSVEARQGNDNPSGQLLLSEKHFFLAMDAEYRICTSTSGNGTGYEKWQNAREFRTEQLTGNGTEVVVRNWEQRAPVTWAPDPGYSFNWYASQHGQEQPPNDPRVTYEDTILENGKMKRVEHTYDQFNNVTSTKEYDFGTEGSPGQLLRETTRTYAGSGTTPTVNGYCYTNLNPQDGSCGNGIATDSNSIIHQRNVILSEAIKDGQGNLKAYAEYEYDNYSSDSNHAPVYANSGMINYDGSRFSAFSGQYAPHGNVTKVSRWAGGSSYVYAFTHYDNAGNAIWSKDPRGYVSTVSYTDNFGDGSNPDSGTGGTNGATYSAATLATNPLGHQAWTQYDYTRGVVTGVKDPNGVITRSEYDNIGRPLRVTAAYGVAGQQAVSEATYPTATSNFSTSSKQLDATRWLSSKTEFDGFGRAIVSYASEDGQHASAASFTLQTRTEYDGLGRAFKVSNPYRPSQGGTPVYTTTVYDAAGRVISVTTPDGAQVVTAHNGDMTTVTDPAGKVKRSLTNALGKLAHMIEDPAGLNYQTNYTYDVLGNLLTVTQGAQHRYFMYDPLSRLIRTKNPEEDSNSGIALYDPATGNSQWSIGYSYDDNGNLTTRVDALGVTTSYGYDALNRNTGITYTNDPASTPSITRQYDGAVNGIGRLWAEYAGTVSQMAIDSYDVHGQPTAQRQHFYSGGSWGPAYTTQRSYDRVGNVLTQTYPSGHTVTYAYDGAGRTQGLTGYLGDGVLRTYAADVQYDEWGSIYRERFGTDTPLYHKERRNVRGQLYDIRLSSVNDDGNWNRGAVVNYFSLANYGYGTSGTDNNGNLYVQQYWIPGDDNISTYSFMQENYGYDSLNRLTWVGEYQNGSANTGNQYYGYDQYGNRIISSASGTGINGQQFAVDTNTNRLGVPAGFGGTMQYDAKGNLYNDTYSGYGSRTFDAENRMTSATNNGGLQSIYTYDAGGRRVRRNSFNQETWQVYGMGGELLAEYAAGSAPSSPQKEYGYRNGQLLVTASAGVNLALNKPTSQSSTGWGGESSRAVDGNTNGNWTNNSVTHTFYDNQAWWQVDLGSQQAIQKVDVWNRTDCCANRLTNFNVIILDQNQGVVASYNTAGQAGNPTSININATGRYVKVQLVGTDYLSLAEVQVWGSGPDVRWMVADQLGTPRMIADKTGTLAGVSRHDYLPFGEELYAGTGSRTSAQGYGGSDNLRQQFTQKERDSETGLDYFGARYYSSYEGRFTGVDPYNIAAEKSKAKTAAFLTDPQKWNRYSYASNNPLNRVDPDGRNWFYVKGKNPHWEWHEGDTATINGKTQKSNVTHLLIVSKLGKNQFGATIVRLTLMEQKNVVGQYQAFSGGATGTREIPDGNYIINLNRRGVLGPTGVVATGKDLYETKSFNGVQVIPPEIPAPTGKGVLNMQYEWGSKRMYLEPKDPNPPSDAYLNYLHGKQRPGDYTHGCVCDRSERLLNTLYNLDYKRNPAVGVWAVTSSKTWQ